MSTDDQQRIEAIRATSFSSPALLEEDIPWLLDLVERQQRTLSELQAFLGGWRELIAMLDDMPKDEAVGKAMWVALDQIDRVRAEAVSDDRP